MTEPDADAVARAEHWALRLARARDSVVHLRARLREVKHERDELRTTLAMVLTDHEAYRTFTEGRMQAYLDVIRGLTVTRDPATSAAAQRLIDDDAG